MLQTCKILVATSCAGTGLDIRSVGQIVVVGLPYSVEQLLQWAGRLREDGFISVFTSASHLKENSELSGESSGYKWFCSE
jgi:superfamily II DNA/RNA helicase